jgi:tetratricopeptide (TPR) repeat protein
MRRALNLMASFLLLLLLSPPLSAQARQRKPPVKKPAEGEAKTETQTAGNAEPAVTAIQQQALNLLNHLFEQAKEFDDEAARIKTRAQIADTLWEHDEARARGQFEEAFRAVADIKGEREDESSMFSPLSRLRSELLRLIAPRDMALAEKLLKTIPDAPTKDNSALTQFFGAQSQQSQVAMELALELASTDPQRAAQMAQASLQSGINMMFPQVLQKIQQKEPELADRLFLQALAAAQKDTARPTMKLLLLAPYAFPGFGGFSPEALLGGQSAPPRPPNPALIEPFLNFAYQSVMQELNVAPPGAPAGLEAQVASALGQLDYMSVQVLLPLFDQHQPERAAMIRTRMHQLGANLADKDRRQLDFFTNLSHNPSTGAQELINRAERESNPQLKDSHYLTAAMRLAQEGEIERALSLLDKISMEVMKKSLASLIRFQAVTKALGQGEVETAYRHAKEVLNLAQRAHAFSRIAQKLLERNDLARAVEMLNEAERLIGKAGHQPEKARALLELAAAMTQVDALRGFEVLKTAVEAINRTDFNPALQQTFAMDLSGAVAVGGDALSFDHSFAPLARTDFQRALLLAQDIEKKELSASAQISVCRGVLLKPREKQKERAAPAKEPKEEPAAKPGPEKKP